MTMIRHAILVLMTWLFVFPSAAVYADDIHMAAKGGLVGRIRSLAEEDPSVLRQADSDGNTPLHIAAAYDKEMAVAEILSHKIADVNATNHQGETPLYKAVCFAGSKTVALLREWGADPFITTTDKRTLLHAAAISIHKDSPAVARTLIEAGLPINAKEASWWGMTPLHAVARSGNHHVAGILISNGADVSMKDKLGRIPLHWAAEGGKTEVARVLIRHKSPMNLLCANSGPPLNLAVAANQVEMAELLLQEKSDVTVEDANGKTALRLALELNRQEIIALLVQYGAKK